MKENVLVIELGTQLLRAGVVAPDGRILSIEEEPLEIESPFAGWAQQRPDAWWEACARGIRRLGQNLDSPADSILAICCCGQMHGPVGLDEAGNVTTVWTQLWCDRRCEVQVAAFRRSDCGSQALTGNRSQTTWMAMKIQWLREHEPDVFARTRCFLAPKDYLNYRLTGVRATDPSEASGTFLWEAARQTWSPAMSAMLGLDPGRFPAVKASHEIVGFITPDAAEATGLPVGVAVVTGGGDLPASLLGIGLAGDELAVDVTGTSTLLAIHRAEPVKQKEFTNLHHVVDGWVAFASLDCGGLGMKWFLQALRAAHAAELTYGVLNERASRVPVGSDGLLFLPFLLGERGPDSPGSRAAFLGLTLGHTAAHMARAVMEGVAFAANRHIDAFRRAGVLIDGVRAAGGAVRNRLWNQIKANVYGVPLEVVDDTDAILKGGAILAQAGVGLVKDVAATARARASRGTLVLPDPEMHEAYQKAQAEYDRAYEHMKGFWIA